MAVPDKPAPDKPGPDQTDPAKPAAETKNTRGTSGGKPSVEERALIPATGTSTVSRSTATDSKPPAPKPETRGGFNNTCNSDQCKQINAAWEAAKELVDRALEHLDVGFGRDRSPANLRPETAKAFEWHFHTLDATSVAFVHGRFVEIRDRLKEGLKIFSCADLERACQVPIPVLSAIPANFAYTKFRDFPIVLCPVFFLISVESQAVTILHEAGHNVGLSVADGTDVYINTGRYRALTTEEALNTTDCYANFASDNVNVNGIPGRGAITQKFGEARVGVALSTDEAPQIVLSYGYALEFDHPVLRVMVPTVGFEFIYMPKTEQADKRALMAGMLGARLGERGTKTYLDLRAGVTVGQPTDGNPLKSVLVEASAHIQAGRFDISAFFQAHQSIFSAEAGKIIIGVGGNFE